ncbi:MAG: SUMF1/EgtB/PvdO family nonheme iron enzyme, partial [Planctomycetota bacterium]|nr:SUMF1/EgtB/PvdO family nonheme iron enzyme [Planctomycetota bacterium]
YGPFTAGDRTDPSGPAGGQRKVIRGGSWGYVAGLCRCAAREEADPDTQGAYVGLRGVMAAP